MTIIEVLTLFLIIFSSYYFGEFLGSYFGLWGWIVGIPAGGALVILVRYLLYFLLLKLFPHPPLCKNKKCTGDDYEIIEYQDNDNIIWKCKCGIQYLQCIPYFKEILPDGSTRPYLKKNRIGRWKSDSIIDEI